MFRDGADRIGVGGAQIDLPAEGGNEVAVGFVEEGLQGCLIELVGVHRRRWRCILNPFFQGSTSIGCVGQRLDDHTFLVNQNDVSIPKHFHVEGSLPVFGVKRKRQHTVKAHLPHPGQSSVAQVLSQDHGKRWRRHGHGAVPL